MLCVNWKLCYCLVYRDFSDILRNVFSLFNTLAILPAQSGTVSLSPTQRSCFSYPCVVCVPARHRQRLPCPGLPFVATV